MKSSGFSLVELMVAVTLLGIMASIAAPRFAVAMETAKVDICTAQLRSIWIAQRMYWLEKGTYSETLDDLFQMKLIEGQLVTVEDPFRVYLVMADVNSFQAAATRSDSTWEGTITINEVGEIQGEIEDEEGRSVRPVP